jgi:hypothetical protein
MVKLAHPEGCECRHRSLSCPLMNWRRRILSVASKGLEPPCDSSGWNLRPLFDAHITQVADNLVAFAIVLRITRSSASDWPQ